MNSPPAKLVDNSAATEAPLDGRTLGPSFYDGSTNNTVAAAVAVPGVGGIITAGPSTKPPAVFPFPILPPPDNAPPHCA